jgi:hypothetical protein
METRSNRVTSADLAHYNVRTLTDQIKAIVTATEAQA